MTRFLVLSTDRHLTADVSFFDKQEINPSH
jgi:hypothetical protein